MSNYNLEYHIGKSLNQTIMFNKPKALCRWKRKRLIADGFITHGKLKLKLVK